MELFKKNLPQIDSNTPKLKALRSALAVCVNNDKINYYDINDFSASE